jgi:hypothetical protein
VSINYFFDPIDEEKEEKVSSTYSLEDKKNLLRASSLLMKVLDSEDINNEEGVK